MDVPELIRKEGLRRGLSIRTIKTYRNCVRLFFKQCNKDPKIIKKKDIKDFLDRLIEKGSPGNTINVYLNALKFFYNEILHKRLMIRIRFSKTPKALPTILTKDEIQRLIQGINNPKYKLMIKLIYSAGFRVSELVHLKPEHFELNENYGWVRKGKCNKDRLFIIADTLKKELIEYIKKECLYPYSWLFRGHNGHITVRTVQNLIKQAAKRAKIFKNVHPHTLRHSFATHLIKNGYDISNVQFLLGHSNTETTMQYVHTSSPKMISVKSPLDSL